MSWERRVANIQVGDRVAYKASFLRNTGQVTGNLPLARGIVTELKPFGDNTLAVIDWDRLGVPEKVLVSNLSKVTTRGLADE